MCPISVYHKSELLNSTGTEKRKNTIPSVVLLCYTIDVKMYLQGRRLHEAESV